MAYINGNEILFSPTVNITVKEGTSLVKLVAPEAAIVPIEFKETPEGLSYRSSSFTPSGATAYIDGDNAEAVFFAVTESANLDLNPVGFTVDLGEEMAIEQIQLHYFQTYYDTQMRIETSSNGTNFEFVKLFTIPKKESGGKAAIRELINVTTRYIRIIQVSGWTRYRFVLKGIEFFAPLTDGGRYDIINGDTIESIPVGEYYDNGYDGGYLKACKNFITRNGDTGDEQYIKLNLLPKGLTELRAYLFYYAKLEYTAVLPENITTLWNGVFSNARYVSKIVLHDKVTNIGANQFWQAPSLVTVVFSKGVTKLQSGIFNSCPKLKTVTNMGNITSIPSSTFQGSTALEYIEFESLKVDTSGVKLNYSSNLTVECLVGILNSLVDMTGEEGTHTLYLGSTNIAKLTDEQQSIAWNKNIILA